METCCTTAPQGSACANTAHSAPPPPARKSLLSHISIRCNVHAHGTAPRMRPASLNPSSQRSDQQDTNRAHTGFYGAAGKPFHRITIMIITGQTPPVRQDSSDCVYAPEGHTLPQQEKKKGCLCSVNIHRGFFMETSKHVAPVKRCSVS